MNSFCGIGRLTGDPETYQNANTTIVKYTIAIDRMDGDADFLRCVCFGKVADFASKYLSKGLKVGISGRVQTSRYEDKDGKKVSKTEIVVNTHTFCEKANMQQLDAAGKAQQQKRQQRQQAADNSQSIQDVLSDFEEVGSEDIISDGALPF